MTSILALQLYATAALLVGQFTVVVYNFINKK